MKKNTIGYIAGVFDLFHIGHLNLLKNAKSMCTHLIVGVLTDELAVRYKKRPPYIPESERREIVNSIKYVDETVLVNPHNIDKMKAWELYHFDYLFSGDDWRNEASWIADREKLNAVGADIIFFPYTKTTSSTQLKKQIGASLDTQEKKIIIFGAGAKGRKALELCSEYSIYAFVDNNTELVGSMVEGVPVIAFASLGELFAEYKVVVACKDYRSVVKQLLAVGIRDFEVF